nr:immunoglobulin heavy chain junction region [Macaca mulatta]MOW99765.1 immunoglobulin heavy chain junction region [Macaca mulatta]MOX02631.1 immunoglobulin heavy chain junction region [Macaca mulatta]MOX04519.1 immunoglobulin heavy chain junction region [Macaca mulatta]MOX04530.1 immunoglobulin heavy chain junction region [Macaca mulatta]
CARTTGAIILYFNSW